LRIEDLEKELARLGGSDKSDDDILNARDKLLEETEETTDNPFIAI
jgi:hypothetical protein